ncbi:MAG: hypothetical protein U0132_04940 [Gemmatimonadaceae bacterium]
MITVMPRLTRWFLASACLVLAALPLRLQAQELDMLELDDFVNPRELQLKDAPGGSYRFLASRVYVGAAERENFRGDFYKSRVHFGRLATAYYAGRWQLTAKLTDYDTRTHRDPPYFRSRAQVARYLGGSDSRQPVRLQFSWTFNQSRVYGSQNEYAVDLSTSVDVPGTHVPVVGGVVYSVDPERNIHYAGLAAQLPVLTWKHESSIRLGGSVAQDQDEASHVVTRAPNLYKGMVALALGIPGTDSRIYAAYSPTYRRAIKEWNHEVTLMLDASVFVKLLK